MSGFKQNSLVISEKNTPVPPSNAGDVTIVARNGDLYKYDGVTETLIGGESAGDFVSKAGDTMTGNLTISTLAGSEGDIITTDADGMLNLSGVNISTLNDTLQSALTYQPIPDIGYMEPEYIGLNITENNSMFKVNRLLLSDSDGGPRVASRENDVSIISYTGSLHLSGNTGVVLSAPLSGAKIRLVSDSLEISQFSGQVGKILSVSDEDGGISVIDIPTSGPSEVLDVTAIGSTFGTATPIDVDASVYNSVDVRLEGYGKINIPSNMNNGQSINYLITQDTSPYEWDIDYDSSIEFPQGVPIIPMSGADSTTILTMLKIRNRYFMTGLLDFI